MRISHICLASLAFALASSAAVAQSASPQGSAARAAAEPVPQPSPLDGYRPFSDEALIPWKEANEQVGRIGGWREYARESREAPSGSSSPAPARQEPGRSGGHGQH